jgi:hypothetical protein
MRTQHGDFTKYDANVPIQCYADVDLTGMEINVEITKPSGATMIRPCIVSGTTGTYFTALGEFDEAGKHEYAFFNKTLGQYMIPSGSFYVKSGPGDEAME